MTDDAFFQAAYLISSQGQRYHVVVTALPSSTANAFWIRISPADGCSGFNPDFGAPEPRQGIVYYGDSPQPLPTTQRVNYSLACRDEPYEKLVPIIPWTIGKASNPRKKSIVSWVQFS